MFENETNPMTPPAPPQGQTPPVAPSGDVHTMPERFMDSGMSQGAVPPTGGGGGSMRKILIIVLVVVVVGALGGGAWYYFKNLKNANANANKTNVANTNQVVNRNLNVNSTLNTNLSNANLNLNVNANANTNLNVNTNANVNASVNTNTSTTGTKLPSSTDSDNDGLTDIEEQVYGTTTTNNDTDGDGFIDGMRVLANGKLEGEAYNSFCPTKKGSVRLDDADCAIMRTYTNPTYNFALWVPKNWLAQTTSGDNKTVIITPDIATTEFFQVSVLDNPTQLSAKNYYLSMNPGADATKAKDASVNGLDGVLSLDESTAYFVKGTRTYVVSYNTDALQQANFRTTFMIIYRSFHLVASSTNTNANVNTNSAVTNANANRNTNANANVNTNQPPILGQ